jgi:ribosomal protein S6E (S10)
LPTCATFSEEFGANTGGGIYSFPGPVGIGTTAPTAKLDVREEIRVTDANGSLRVRMGAAQDGGFVQTFGPNGSLNSVLEFIGGNHNHGSISARDANGEERAQMFVSDDGRGYFRVRDVNGSERARMFVDGSGRGVVSADIKNFSVPHPNQPGKEIVYASIEGPEAAAYARGTGRLVNGRAIIALPEHFTAIAAEETMTIQLTPRSAESLGLAVVEKSLTGVVVRELFKGSGSYDFDFLIMAVRRGYENYQPVRSSADAKEKPAKASSKLDR